MPYIFLNDSTLKSPLIIINVEPGLPFLFFKPSFYMRFIHFTSNIRFYTVIVVQCFEKSSRSISVFQFRFKISTLNLSVTPFMFIFFFLFLFLLSMSPLVFPLSVIKDSRTSYRKRTRRMMLQLLMVRIKKHNLRIFYRSVILNNLESPFR